jgi:molybdopterin-containing oxidoreductase family iron-sulfur binding subunit
LDAIAQRLGSTQGKQYWRTLEELADSEAFRELMRCEFPEQADVWPDGLSRRQFLTLMGASLALAGLSGCSVRPAPSVELTPYVRQPEQVVPGKPLFFATAMSMSGVGVGLLVESHLGRPTKIEGNTQHPASLGGTDLFHQASILTLYDPDRSQTVTYLARTSTWDDALGDVATSRTRPTGNLAQLLVDEQDSVGSALLKLRARHGAGLRILTETVVSPTLGRQLRDLLRALPEAKWHQYEPVNRDNARRAEQWAFGKPVNVYHRFYDLQADRPTANVVLSLDADFLTCGPGHLRNVKEFMRGRRVRTSAANAKQAQMNRLYMVESNLTSTGAKADHRLALRPSEVEPFARAVARRLADSLADHGHGELKQVVSRMGAADEAEQGVTGAHEAWIKAVADDLALPAHRGRSVVIAGDCQPPAVHLLAHALNRALDNVGKTVFHTLPIEVEPTDQVESLRALLADIDAGRVELLLILDGNPVFTAPADFNFAERVRQWDRKDRTGKLLRAHLSLFEDETSRLCHWHLPMAHYLECWGDTRAYDGTATIAQPLIEPLYGGLSAHEMLDVVVNRLQRPGREIVRDYWRRHWQDQGRKGAFEDFWETSVHDGVVAGTAFRHQPAGLRPDWEGHLEPASQAGVVGGLELLITPDPTIYDGRFANNAWLQELPKPITKVTWDNTAMMSPRTAQELGVGLDSYAHAGEHGGYHPNVVELTVDNRTVRAPVWIVPGHADGVVTVTLGYGREAAGRVGGKDETQVGFNAYLLRTSDRLWSAPAVGVKKTRERYSVACTQQHQMMENRELVRTATLAEYHKKPDFAAEADEKEQGKFREAARRRSLEQVTLYDSPVPFQEAGKPRWAMVIDQTACTGCKACVVACQAENNIPVVGKEQVAAGREMHWLRIDRYNVSHIGSDTATAFNNPDEFYFQPLPCMHCERAPCEYVCPTAATVHSAEGLNDMVYQRCVGTRFCSNNCPYKVRRFNFFFYADYATQSIRQQYNPDVTVRSRGVMEKCSYCVQRIRHAEIDAQVDGRTLRDGEVLTACQAACPADAIVFGDWNDEKSEVAALKKSPLHYGLLTELNTDPRTTYLAALRNPNPDLEKRRPKRETT